MNRAVVLLLNWNNWGDTLECLESLFCLDFPLFTVIVCDNGSQDDSLSKIEKWADGKLDVLISKDNPLRRFSWPPCSKPISRTSYDRRLAERGGDGANKSRLILIDIGKNLGFAGGCNVGLRFFQAHAEFDFVWLLNNDTVVAPDALSAMVRRFKQQKNAGICGSKLLEYNRPENIQALGGAYYNKWFAHAWHLGRLKKSRDRVDPARVEAWMDYVVGASMLVRREFIEKVGLLCEDYFLFFEEIDWMVRARQRFSPVFAADSTVYHKVGASIGTSSNPAKKSALCDFYNIRSRLIFTKKHYPWALPTVYLGIFAALLGRILMGSWRQAKMIAMLMVHCGEVDFEND